MNDTRSGTGESSFNSSLDSLLYHRLATANLKNREPPTKERRASMCRVCQKRGDAFSNLEAAHTNTLTYRCPICGATWDQTGFRCGHSPP